MLRIAQLFASLLLFASLCNCNKPLSEAEKERRAQEEQAAAEQARRDAVAAEVTAFVDDLWMQRSELNDIRILRANGRPIKPGSVLASPAGYSVTFTKEEGDYFWFVHDEAAFSLTLKKPAVGLSIAERKRKLPRAYGWKLGRSLSPNPKIRHSI